MQVKNNAVRGLCTMAVKLLWVEVGYHQFSECLFARALLVNKNDVYGLHTSFVVLPTGIEPVTNP